MKCRLEHFDATAFSFEKDPVLILDGFWSKQEGQEFHADMQASMWGSESAQYQRHGYFIGSGDWEKARPINGAFERYRDRILALRCVTNYLDSMRGVEQHLLSMYYFRYHPNGCLPLHNDAEEYPSWVKEREHCGTVIRRLAHISYWNPAWNLDWGGELMIYDEACKNVTHCIPPAGGRLVLFTTPRHHRVNRVDPISKQMRISSAGWISTQLRGALSDGS